MLAVLMTTECRDHCCLAYSKLGKKVSSVAVLQLPATKLLFQRMQPDELPFEAKIPAQVIAALVMIRRTGWKQQYKKWLKEAVLQCTKPKSVGTRKLLSFLSSLSS
jgi:hypothetical protein